MEDIEEEMVPANLAALEYNFTAIRNPSGSVNSAQRRSGCDGADVFECLNSQSSRNVHRGIAAANDGAAQTGTRKQCFQDLSE